MKLIRKSILAVLMAAMPLAGGVLAHTGATERFVYPTAVAEAPMARVQTPMRADDDGLMTLGWCRTSYGQSFIVTRSDNDPHVLSGAVYFPKEVLKKFKGDQIKYVDFAVQPKRGSRVTVFVSTDLMGGYYQVSGTTTEWQEGWNRCALNSAYTITGDEDLYVGYMVNVGPDEDLQTVSYDNSGDAENGYNFVGIDGDWFSAAGLSNYMRIRAIIDGDSRPNNDVQVVKIDSQEDYVEQNKGTWNPTLWVRNWGKEPVTSLHVQALVDGQVVSEIDTDDDFELAEGERSTVSVNGLRFNTPGTYEVTLKVTKVNGKDDPDMSDNTASRTIFCLAEGAKNYTHNVLFEHFTSEHYNEAYKADSLYNKVFGARKDIIWVHHHRAVLGVNDKLAVKGEDVYNRLYGGTEPFMPGVCADRRIFSDPSSTGPAYFVATADDTEGMIYGAKTQLTYVGLDIDVSKSADGKTVNATVSGTAATPKLQQQTDLRLTVWLVEDCVKSDTQEGVDGTYVHNGVLRRMVTDAWGEPLDLSSLEFSRSYEIPVDEGWNVDNMRVVAFVSNYDSDSYRNLQVYNSAQTFVDPNTAISDLGATAAPAVAVKDGQVVVIGSGYELKSVCDLSGRTVQPSHVTPGIYVVTISNGKSNYTQKLYVK